MNNNNDKIDKDLQQIIDTVAGAVETGIKQLADGFQYTDIFAFIPVLSSIPEAIKDANNALHYLKDMSEEKEETIVQAVLAKLGNSSEKVQSLVRRVLRLLAEAYMTWVAIASFNPPGTGTGVAAGTGKG